MTARRVDSLGLDERAITMVEFLDKEEFIYKKQREDTIEKLDTISEKSLKMRLSKPALIILGVAMILALSSFALPNLSSETSSSNNASVPSSVEVPPSQTDDSTSELTEEEIIQQLLEKLRELIEKSAVDREFKDQLYAVVDKLEVDLKSLSTLEEKINLIETTREEIQKMIEEELLRLSVGRCLKQYDITRELGSAILAATADESKLEQVAIALENIKTKLKISENYEEDLETLIEALNEAINTATKEENEALIQALSNFRDQLVASPQSKKHIRKLEKEDLDIVFEDASNEIQDALKKSPDDTEEKQGDASQDTEDLGKDLDDALQDAQDKLTDLNQKKDDDGNEDDDNNEDSGNTSGGEDGGDNPPPKFDEGDIDSDTVIDGNTPYLDVFDSSREEIEEYLAEHEDLPEDVRKAIEAYLEMLKVK